MSVSLLNLRTAVGADEQRQSQSFFSILLSCTFNNAEAAHIERHLAMCNWFVGGRGRRMRARFGGCGFDARCVAYVDVAVLIVFCDDLLEST